MKKDIFIRQLESTSTVSIGGEFDSRDVGRIHDVQCSTEKKFEFNNYTVMEFTHCHFTSLTISGNCKLNFSNCQIELLNITDGEVMFTNLHGCKLLKNSSAKTISINASANENMKITLQNNISRKGLKFNIYGCRFDGLVFNTRQEKCKVKILDSEFNSLIFTDFKITENSHVLISNSNVDKLLRFSDSDLSYVEFINCSFFKATHLIDNSSFKNAKFFSINWFKTIYLTSDKDKRSVDNFGNYERSTEFKEGYREYKTIMQSLKNRPDEIYFKAKEYNAKRKQTKFFSRKFGEKLILILNTISNNHGQWWLLPLSLIMVLAPIFYFLFVWSLNSTEGFLASIEYMRDNWAKTFLSINPTHRVSTVVNNLEELTNKANFINWVFRIISAFLIFQTITAFRKYKD